MSESKSAPFTEYLDKEMNIMGILSVFCVAVAGFSVDRTAGAATTGTFASMWPQSAPLIAAGAVAALLAAFSFYRQRSSLAWYIGQITLAEVGGRPARVKELLTDADAWDTWIHYRIAFLCLFSSFFWLALAVGRQMFPSLAHVRQRWLIGVPSVALIAVSATVQYLFTKYRTESDSPWEVFWAKLWHRHSSPAARPGTLRGESE